MYRTDVAPPWDEFADPGEGSNVTDWARGDAWLHEVAMTPERDLRGHRITLTYHTLSVNLYAWIYDVQGVVRQDDLIGQHPPVNANWFNFATWATATLNADIRNDSAPYRSDRLVPPGFYRRLTPTVLAIKSANRQRYNQLLTWYQRMVFVNTTSAYSAMRTFADAHPSEEFASIEDGEIRLGATAWMKGAQELVKPRDGKSALEEERHLKPVAMAFEYYRRAREVTLALDGRREGERPTATQTYLECLRARLIFFANLIITSVEQDIVDPGVERVLNNVPDAASEYLSNHLSRVAQHAFGVPRQLAGLRIPLKLKPAEDAFGEMWVRLLTRELLILGLPAETLRLGHDIPPLAAGEPFFPKELFDLQALPNDGELQLPEDGYVSDRSKHEKDNDDLQRTVWAFDRSDGDGCGTGARDWRRIAERLNWATTLIRTRVQDVSLFWPPFRNEDVERIARGKLPLHPGNPTDFDVLGPLESFTYLCGGHD